jgi:hypothetical protein
MPGVAHATTKHRLHSTHWQGAQAESQRGKLGRRACPVLPQRKHAHTRKPLRARTCTHHKRPTNRTRRVHDWHTRPRGTAHEGEGNMRGEGAGGGGAKRGWCGGSVPVSRARVMLAPFLPMHRPSTSGSMANSHRSPRAISSCRTREGAGRACGSFGAQTQRSSGHAC